jgi:hypothetical protein
MIYFCSQKKRRALVLQSPDLNGIDYLEVTGDSVCGKKLSVTLLKDARTLVLTPDNVTVTGGEPVEVSSVLAGTNDDPFVLTVNLKETGDFSTYTLALVAGPGITDPPDGFDPQLSSVGFSFKAGCPTPADCVQDNCCPAISDLPPDINYLARDFEGFRQVMLDRLASLSPSWKETHVPDLGVAVVETLAYAADHLSYQQDAASTEAYLGTARSRISLRRHAHLVDYQIDEGCNARTWMCFTVNADNVEVPCETLFYVRVPGLPLVAKSGDPVEQSLAKAGQPVFAVMQKMTAFVEQNKMQFYTWGDADCCLAAGATEATLDGNFLSLKVGDVLVFQEIVGPKTGDTDDADPSHRWAVRLTGVSTTDYKQRTLADPITKKPVTRITWGKDDALPFPLCLSSTVNLNGNSVLVAGVSVAVGNVVPADHGIWTKNEPMGEVPPAPPDPAASVGCTCGSQSSVAASRPRFYPELVNSPLTFRVSFDDSLSASAFLSPYATDARPQIKVRSDDGGNWQAERDLLSSDDLERVFVPEIEHEGSVFLRFGDGQYGMSPKTGVSFFATYRVGSGSIGNVGRDTLTHVVLPPGFSHPLNSISSVTNPLAAAGGIDPENMEHIRQYAPFAYTKQLRCVTEADYDEQAATINGVREARGTLRWTGSWHTAFVSIDPATSLTPKLESDVTQDLNLLRMMGTDLAVEGAVLVGLRIEMQICVDPQHFQGSIFSALMKVFLTGNQCSGQTGLLNASNFSFGQTVYASPLVAAAQEVEGVLSAVLTVFTRMDDPSIDGVSQGFLTMGRLEIPRCDNDPNHLDHGTFVLHLDGGK